MSKSLLRRKLQTGCALIACLTAAGMALPALADHHKSAKPPVKPVVSETFKSESKVTADRTMKVYQTGTSDAAPVEAKDRLLPAVDGKAVVCDDKDAAWKHVPEDVRRDARPGECFARLLKAPDVEVYMDKVMVSPERVESRTIPAEVRTVDKDVVVRPARVERRTVPAVVTTRMETEVVREAGFREEVIPARYETRVERVLVSPARQEWVKSQGEALDAPLVTPNDHEPMRYRKDGYLSWPGKEPQRVETDDEARLYLEDGNPPAVWCLKDIPAVYRDEKRKVMVEPERVRRVEIPAVTRQVKRTVVERPERVEEYTVPAVYEKRRVKEVVSEARTESRTLPAVYKDVEKTRVTGPAEGVWRQVLCDRNAPPQLIMKIQKALAAKGYDPGPVDGQLGGKTAAAMQKFQADNGLPQGQVSVEAVKALGIDLLLVH